MEVAVDRNSLDILSDDCLIQIFRQFDVKKRIYLSGVSKRWTEVVRMAFRQIRNFYFEDEYFQRTPCWVATEGLDVYSSGQHIFTSLINQLGSHLDSIHFGEKVFLGDLEMERIGNHCCQLKELDLSWTRFTSSAISKLKGKLNQLEKLDLRSCFRVSNPCWSCPCRPDKVILADSNYVGVEEKIREVITSMPMLKNLMLNWTHFEGICLPNTTTNIEVIRLCGMEYLKLDRLETFLMANPQLKKFQMEGGQLGVKVPKLLGQFCKNLSSLSIRMVDNDESDTNDSDNDESESEEVCSRNLIEGLANLTRLEKLNVSENKFFNNATLEVVSTNCQQLKILDLSWTGVTNAGLEHIGGLKNLEKLSLSDLKISTLSFINPIGKTLKSLDISYNPITDASLISLGRYCTQLRLLYVNSTDVTENGVTKFLQIFTSHGKWKSDPSRKLNIYSELQNVDVTKWDGRITVG